MKCVIFYRGGEGSEVASFTQIPSAGQTIWLIPPSDRARLQATRERPRLPIRGNGFGDYHEYLVTHVSKMADGTPRITVEYHEPAEIDPYALMQGVDGTLYDLGYNEGIYA